MKGRVDQELHEVLRMIPYGLQILGVRGEGGETNATVVSWLMQCSFFPPLIAVALRKPSRTLDLLLDGNVFSVNFIDSSHQEIARELVKPYAMVGDKLHGLSFSEETTGAPILDEAFAFLECNVQSINEPGDHAIVVGEVIRAGFHGEGKPLTCADMGWHYGG